MSKGYDLGDLFRSARPKAEARSVAEPNTEQEQRLPSCAATVQSCGKLTRKATYELDAELLKRVNDYAKARDMKKLAVIERALQEYLDRNGV